MSSFTCIVNFALIFIREILQLKYKHRHIRAYVQACPHRTHARTLICICLCIFMYMYMYICICIYIYIYIYSHSGVDRIRSLKEP